MTGSVVGSDGDDEILGLKALGFLSRVIAMALWTMFACSAVLWQLQQLHPSQNTPAAKHSQYNLRHLLFLQLQRFLLVFWAANAVGTLLTPITPGGSAAGNREGEGEGEIIWFVIPDDDTTPKGIPWWPLSSHEFLSGSDPSAICWPSSLYPYGIEPHCP